MECPKCKGELIRDEVLMKLQCHDCQISECSNCSTCQYTNCKEFECLSCGRDLKNCVCEFRKEALEEFKEKVLPEMNKELDDIREKKLSATPEDIENERKRQVKIIEKELMEANKGLKFDKNKCRLDLLPTEFLEGVAWILTFGVEKYDAENWRKGINYKRIYGSLQRHLQAWYAGDSLDQESGKPHLWHAGCCLAFLITYEEHRDIYAEFDDRYLYKDESVFEKIAKEQINKGPKFK